MNPLAWLLNPTALIEFMLKYWKELAVIGMLLIIIYQNFANTELLRIIGLRTIPGLREEIVEIQQNLDTCRDNKVKLQAAIEEQNRSIEQWEQVSTVLAERNQQLDTKIKNMKQKSQQNVTRILNEPTPQTCSDSINLLRNAAQGELKWPK